jgi:protein ImuB
MQQKTFGKARPSAWIVPDAALYPTWLLEQPLPLAIQAHRPLYQGALQLLVGPQRLEVMGWDQVDAPAATLRDYFIALSPHAGLLWVYRERLPQGRGSDAWYLHGIYA